MADNGIRTPNLPQGVLMEFLGHADAGGGQRTLARQSVSVLADYIRDLVFADPTGVAGIIADLATKANEIANLADAINAEATARGNAVSGETNARINAVSQLDTRFSGALSRAINAEIIDRDRAISAATALLVTTANALAGALNTEISARGQGDAAIGLRIDTVRAALLAAIADLDASSISLQELPGLLARSFVAPASVARPGDGPAAFTLAASLAALGGAPETLPPIPPETVRADASGLLVPIVGAGIVAAREAEPIEPGHLREVRVTLVRLAAPSDPQGDTVEVGVVWLDRNRVRLSAGPGILVRIGDLGTGTPRRDLVRVIGTAPGDGIDLVAPAGAAYYRRYVYAYGLDGVTGVSVLSGSDVTALAQPPAITQDVLARLAGIESEQAGQRLDVIEAQAAAPRLVTYTTRSDAAAATITPSVRIVRTLGRMTDDDALGTDYQRVAGPLAPGADGFASQDGAVWQALQAPVSQQFAATRDYVPTAPVRKSGQPYYPRPLRDHLGELAPTPGDLGIPADGSVDAAPALQRAADALAAAGGGIFRPKGRLLIDTNLELKNNVSWRGDAELPGMIGRFLTTDAQRARTFGEGGAVLRDNPYSDVQRVFTDATRLDNALIVNPAVTIRLGTGSSVSGLVTLRKGLPAISQPTGVPGNTGAEAFAGTPFTVNGDAVTIDRNLVIGFDHLVKASGFANVRISRNLFDCLNGWWVDDAQDRCYFTGNHGYPYATIMSGTAYLTRPGYVGRVTNSIDWSGWADNFGYGYQRPFIVEHSQGGKFVGCCADSVDLSKAPSLQVMEAAYTIIASDGIGILGGHVSGSARHILTMDVSEFGNIQHRVSVSDVQAAVLTGAAYDVRSGALNVAGGAIAAAPIVLRTEKATSRVSVTGLAMRQISDVPWDVAAPSQLRLAGIDYGDWPLDRSPFRKTPLAGERAITYGRPRVDIGFLAPPWGAESVTVTGPADGSGGQGLMLGGYPGRRVRLYASVAITLYAGDTGGSGFSFANGGNALPVPAGSCVEFEYDTNFWQQVR